MFSIKTGLHEPLKSDRGGPNILTIFQPGFRGNRLYVVQEKPSGFKRLAVYQMIWR